MNEKEIMMYANAYMEQIKKIEEDIVKINSLIVELEASKSSIDLLGKDSFVPIGGGMFVKGDIYTERILVPIGLSYYQLMDKKTAKKEIDRRIEASKKTIEKLKKEHESLTKILEEIQNKMNEYAKQNNRKN